ncbi:MAG TPA: RNA 2',3'-cyclic phosphodiesterase [Mycobacteriales bacterium]|nr:RNA 2',3'-cyclic phosphodiesterase [Mycobacteriales bacterium]
MRLFAAIDPSPAAIADLRRAIGETDDALRWLPEEQWHVTLAFYGEVGDDSAEALAVRLERAAARTAPLSLQLAGAGCFPSRPHAARVLWIGLAGDVDELIRLSERCTAAGRREGLAMERRRFRAHLTLGRARGAPVDVSKRLRTLWEYAGPTWSATSLRLVRSTPGPKQARHETVADWPLSA